MEEIEELDWMNEWRADVIVDRVREFVQGLEDEKAKQSRDRQKRAETREMNEWFIWGVEAEEAECFGFEPPEPPGGWRYIYGNKYVEGF